MNMDSVLIGWRGFLLLACSNGVQFVSDAQVLQEKNSLARY